LDSVATNILLVCADNDAGGSLRTAHIGTDRVAASSQVAGLLKAALPEGGKVALLVESDTAQHALEPINGIRDGLAGARIEIIETMVDGMSAKRLRRPRRNCRSRTRTSSAWLASTVKTGPRYFRR